MIPTGENWDMILHNSIVYTGYSSIAFFIIFYIIGNLFIMNLFLAILLRDYDAGDPHFSFDDLCSVLTCGYFKPAVAEEEGVSPFNDAMQEKVDSRSTPKKP